DGWDGNYKGKRADNDTYFYYLIYKNADGVDKSLKGYIMLKR
ncbi:MAG: C-terminal domain of protein family, partial [Bacteroidetes bacterium]|nr:C-terminal domain of protein family [Bacteroidota bacterium]